MDAGAEPEHDGAAAAVAAALAEEARRLFAGPVAFRLSAPSLDILPPPALPEVAFAGRSNVGKSSLLNALTGRSGLARTSNTPGRTQAFNLFDMGEPAMLTLVDMPGYGYADAPRQVARRWAGMVGDYLAGRAVLRRVLLLVDHRHGLKEGDRAILALMDRAAVSTQLVLTKGDKVKEAERRAVADAVAAEARRHPAVHPDILATSAQTGHGLDALRTAVLAAVRG